jgi:predicted nucleotidyltransferase component of viral defense system
VFDHKYTEQVHLLLSCMPAVADEACFALKGGTAINLFVRNMPRVSVDIDLIYLPVAPRDVSLSGIESALRNIKETIDRDLDGIAVKEKMIQGHVAKLTVISPTAEIKIEPNLVLRGALGDSIRRDLCEAAQDTFEVFCSAPVASDADVYAGKLCAALDRQHPRDLFDVKVLLDDTGITSAIRRAFIVYLAAHNRPMHELLDPNMQGIAGTYRDEFFGMAQNPPDIEELKAVQKRLPSMLLSSLDIDEKTFLLSMKSGEPDWNVLGFENLEQMPALQWKLLNIRKMDARKRHEQLSMLQELLANG